jgi:threonine/homoserine/homoserine lactone efflux protein
MRLTAPPRQNTGRRDTEGMAVASFVLGLVGLVVLNVILGPVAIVLAVLALRRDTPRRFRAQLGLALGIADLLLLAVLVTVNGGVAWTAFG